MRQSLLFYRGINANEIMDILGCSKPSAHRLWSEYKVMANPSIHYDQGLRRWVITEIFKPKFIKPEDAPKIVRAAIIINSLKE